MSADPVDDDGRESPLAGLAEWNPEPARAERVRARCHAALSRRRRHPRLQARTALWRPVAQLLGSAVVALVALLYLREVFALALGVLLG